MSEPAMALNLLTTLPAHFSEREKHWIWPKSLWQIDKKQLCLRFVISIGSQHSQPIFMCLTHVQQNVFTDGLTHFWHYWRLQFLWKCPTKPEEGLPACDERCLFPKSESRWLKVQFSQAWHSLKFWRKIILSWTELQMSPLKNLWMKCLHTQVSEPWHQCHLLTLALSHGVAVPCPQRHFKVFTTNKSTIDI